MKPVPSDLRSLGLARILFGAVALWRTTPLSAALGASYLPPATPLLGWPSSAWHVTALGPSLPPRVVAGLCVARTLCLVLFTAGVRTRAFGVAAGMCGWMVLFQDAAAYINALHLLCLGVVALALGGAGSALAFLPEGESDPPSARALVRCVVASVYAWSGLAKINASWLSGSALAHFRDAGVVGGRLAGVVLGSDLGCTTSAWLVAAFELAIGPLLLWGHTRRYAIVAALAFHAALEVTVHPDVLGFEMAILLLAFAAPAARALVTGGWSGRAESRWG